MNFSYFMPTEIFCGRNCVTANCGRLRELGSHALIVTGRSSETNGALADVLSALGKNGQSATLFNCVLPNPTIACVREGIALLKGCGADFVIGLGGGSPMDAAKAIALLAVEERADSEIFSGTGSEVTPYAILTDDERQTKTSISSPALFPRFAFLDGKYTFSLPRAVTVNTALDAFSHAIESLLSKRATPLSRVLATESLRILYPLLPKTAKTLSEEERDDLLYASALAGMAIAQSGTTAVHGMGYQLTYFAGIAHGRANGLLLGETLRLCEEKNLPAVKAITLTCGASVKEIALTLDTLLGEREAFPKSDLLAFAKRSASGKNIQKSAYEPTEEELSRIFLRSLRVK